MIRKTELLSHLCASGVFCQTTMEKEENAESRLQSHISDLAFHPYVFK